MRWEHPAGGEARRKVVSMPVGTPVRHRPAEYADERRMLNFPSVTDDERARRTVSLRDSGRYTAATKQSRCRRPATRANRVRARVAVGRDRPVDHSPGRSNRSATAAVAAATHVPHVQHAV